MSQTKAPRITPRRETTAEVGRILDRRWHLKRVLGEGAMGRVFLAQQLSVHRPVAVKVIRPDLVKDSTAISRFLREARILSGLQHPNIVRLIDFGQERATGELYLVMELLTGQSLSRRIEAAERFSLAEVLTIVEQTLLALAEAHGRGIIHRDLKPGNLYLDRRDGIGLHVTVFDFGIAKLDEPLMPKLTATGRINGTPHYIAPEQIRGVASPQTDLYAIGVMMYELLTGAVPHDGDTIMQVLMSHLKNEPADLRDSWRIPGPVDPQVVDLVRDLLQRDPARRPESAVAACERIRNLRLAVELGGEPVTASDTLAAWRGDLSEDAVEEDGTTAPLAVLADTVTMDGPPEAASLDDAAPEPDITKAPDEADEPAVVGVMGETFDGWAQPPPRSSPWKWISLGLLSAGVIAMLSVVLWRSFEPARVPQTQTPVVAPVSSPPVAAPVTPPPVTPAAAPDPIPAEPATELPAATDADRLAVEDAVETPPVPGIKPVKLPTRRAAADRRKRSKATPRGAKTKAVETRKKKGLGDVLKGMRSP